jgi:hypothetical protein
VLHDDRDAVGVGIELAMKIGVRRLRDGGLRHLLVVGKRANDVLEERSV